MSAAQDGLGYFQGIQAKLVGLNAFAEAATKHASTENAIREAESRLDLARVRETEAAEVRKDREHQENEDLLAANRRLELAREDLDAVKADIAAEKEKANRTLSALKDQIAAAEKNLGTLQNKIETLKATISNLPGGA